LQPSESINKLLGVKVGGEVELAVAAVGPLGEAPRPKLAGHGGGGPVVAGDGERRRRLVGRVQAEVEPDPAAIQGVGQVHASALGLAEHDALVGNWMEELLEEALF
jgi:hypothetical protein